MASNNMPLFPARPSYLCATNLFKELKLSGLATPAELKDPIILLKSELQVLRDLADGKLTCTPCGPPFMKPALRSYPDAEERLRRAAELKSKMLAYDEEHHGPASGPSLEDLERMVAKEQQIQTAHLKMHEEFDEAKALNRVMNYAKCVTVRDAQVLEKKAIAAEKAEEERRMDMAMELDRLKVIRMYEEREAKRREDSKRGAAIIQAQIEECHQQALRDMEMRQREQEAMVRHIEKMKQEDLDEAAKRRENVRRLMDDVALASAEQIRIKAKQKELEAEEERRIAEFLHEKQRKEQEYADEQARIKSEKEKEILRLLAVQERAQDKEAMMLEIRANRAQQEKDAEDRLKAAAERARQQAINEDLKMAHAAQKAQKELIKQEEARNEQEELEKIVAVRLRAEEEARLAQETAAARRRENALDLQKQIAEIEESRRKAHREKLEEGQTFLAEQRERKAIVDAIRQKKMEELERLQVPLRYRQEMMKKQLTESLRPANAKNI